MGDIAQVYRRKSVGRDGQRMIDSTWRCTQDDPLEARALMWQWNINAMETHGRKQLFSM